MGIHFELPVGVVFHPTNYLWIFCPPHGIVHAAPAIVAMVLVCVILLELDVCAARARASGAVLLDIQSGNSEAW